MKKIYIAGPMTGYPEFNFPAFFEAQRGLEAEGWKVANPAAKDGETDLKGTENGDAREAIKNGFDFRAAFAWDIDQVIHGDAIYMLKGWEQSPGARAEHSVATTIQKHYPEYRIFYQ